MIILNKSTATLKIRGTEVPPDDSFETTEMIFNTVDIHSDIGSVVISTEYSIRYIEAFGKLIAFESEQLPMDKQGLKQIVVFGRG